MDNSEQGHFVKGLGLFDSTMVVAGSMIGSGIFLVSYTVAREVNDVALLYVVWLLSGLMTVVGALSFAELAAAMPEAGGVYVYLKEAYNKLTGFVYGWTLLLVIQTGTIAAVAVATAKFFGVLFPWISSKIFIFHIAGYSFLTTEQCIAISSLIILTAINCTGIKSGALVQNIFTVCKVIALLGIIVVGLLFANHTSLPDVTGQALPLMSNQDLIFGVFSLIAIASVGALFSSDAWFGVTFIAAEIKNPSKVLPLALLFGTGLVCLLYFLVNMAYVNVLGLEGIQFASEERVGTATMMRLFGPVGASVMAIIILISTVGCNNGLIMAGSRVYWAMAKDGLFFKKVGTINARFNAPVFSLIVQCVWASILCMSGRYSDILDYVICAGLVFYILTIVAVFRLRKIRPEMNRPYKVILYPYLPILYIALASFIILNLLLYKPGYCWPGVIIVLSGIPVYYIWTALKKPGEVNYEQ